jgi:hypothetical protein
MVPGLRDVHPSAQLIKPACTVHHADALHAVDPGVLRRKHIQ